MREHLSKEIDRLEGRPIHSSEQGVDEFDPPEEREQERQEYERRKEELALDPATGRVTDSTRREAEVTLGLEQMGAVTPPVERADHEGADFTDGNGQDWDVKGFKTMPGKRGDYTRAKAESAIQREIANGEYVALDISKLSQADRDDLKELVTSHPEWASKVVIY